MAGGGTDRTAPAERGCCNTLDEAGEAVLHRRPPEGGRSGDPLGGCGGHDWILSRAASARFVAHSSEYAAVRVVR